MLGGLDPRIKCAVCVGMMTTWRDYLLNRVQTHTWMCYVPLLPKELDYSEILALRAPGAQVEDPLVLEQLAVPDVERLVVDEQPDHLAVGDVDERLAVVLRGAIPSKRFGLCDRHGFADSSSAASTSPSAAR